MDRARKPAIAKCMNTTVKPVFVVVGFVDTPLLATTNSLNGSSIFRPQTFGETLRRFHQLFASNGTESEHIMPPH